MTHKEIVQVDKYKTLRRLLWWGGLGLLVASFTVPRLFNATIPMWAYYVLMIGVATAAGTSLVWEYIKHFKAQKTKEQKQKAVALAVVIVLLSVLVFAGIRATGLSDKLFGNNQYGTQTENGIYEGLK